MRRLAVNLKILNGSAAVVLLIVGCGLIIANLRRYSANRTETKTNHIRHGIAVEDLGVLPHATMQRLYSIRATVNRDGRISDQDFDYCLSVYHVGPISNSELAWKGLVVECCTPLAYVSHPTLKQEQEALNFTHVLFNDGASRSGTVFEKMALRVARTCPPDDQRKIVNLLKSSKKAGVASLANDSLLVPTQSSESYER